MSPRRTSRHRRFGPRPFDVVFYTPRIGQIVSPRGALPPGGTEVQMLMLARALAQRGLRVAIVVFGLEDEMPAEFDGVTIRTRPCRETGRGIVGKLVETMRIWRSLRSVARGTIVYMGGGLELGMIALYARFARRRVVFASASVIDFEARRTEPNRLYHLVYALGVRLAHAVVVQNDEQVAMCEAAFGRRAVVIESLAAAAECSDHEPEAFLWVGRLVSYKRPLDYIALARALPEAKFWMLGVPNLDDDSDRRLAEAVSAEAEAVPNLDLLSPRPQAEAQSLMARAVASVNTSEFEGLPNAMLEAWGRGVPALALSFDPNGVISEYGLGGFAEGSQAKLESLAREMWLGRGDRAAVSSRCQSYIRERHAPETVCEDWLRVISPRGRVDPRPTASPTRPSVQPVSNGTRASVVLERIGRAPTPMRALIIVENSSVPEDRRVWSEALSLRRAGWSVTVLAPDGQWLSRPRPVDEVIEGVQIRRFRLRPADQRRGGHVGEYAAAMWRIWRELPQLARGHPFDVIHACNPPDFLLFAALRQRRHGTALIFDHHDLAPELYSCRPGGSKLVADVLSLFERAAYRVADVVLVTNQSTARLAVERGRKAPEDIFVVRNGPMLERFRPVLRDPALARSREHLLVYVGMIGPQDGVDHALRALAHLKSRRQDWHARFLGDGDTLPTLRELASELGLDDHVEFCGFVPDEEVRRTICSADVCLAPDPRNRYTDRSTLIKIAEYMALSRPIVSYDLIESRATAGRAALYASNNDPAEFAARIDDLLEDPEERRRRGAEGRARVEGGLAWGHSERALLAAYRRATEKRSTSSSRRLNRTSESLISGPLRYGADPAPSPADRFQAVEDVAE